MWGIIYFVPWLYCFCRHISLILHQDILHYSFLPKLTTYMDWRRVRQRKHCVFVLKALRTWNLYWRRVRIFRSLIRVKKLLIHFFLTNLFLLFNFGRLQVNDKVRIYLFMNFFGPSLTKASMRLELKTWSCPVTTSKGAFGPQSTDDIGQIHVWNDMDRFENFLAVHAGFLGGSQ